MIGCPYPSKDGTFRAVFTIIPSGNCRSLFKLSNRKNSNPVQLARQWQEDLEAKKHSSPAALAHYLNVTRARVPYCSFISYFIAEYGQKMNNVD